ncbi:MAG: hypothetical protein ACYTHN_20985 [Planctomycetota bacterium]|jgi:hypothetical protein
MPDNQLTLSEIRDEVNRRSHQVTSLRERLEALEKEIEDLLAEIDELEGVSSGERRRRRRSPPSSGEEAGSSRGARERGETPARRGRPPKRAGKPPKPKPPPRTGPSVVDIAVEILKEWGRAMAPAELAEKVEERGVTAKNIQRVILMAAGRKKSRLKKNEDGTVALTETPGS